MKLKGKNPQKQFIQAIKVIQNAGQFNHPFQRSLFETMIDGIKKASPQSLDNASAIEMQIEFPTGTIPADFSAAIGDMFDVGILADSDMPVDGGLLVAFVPMHLLLTAEALLRTDVIAPTRASFTAAQLLGYVSGEARKFVNKEFPENAIPFG